MKRAFDKAVYDETIEWAENIIEEIESKFFVTDFDVGESAGGFFCENICSVRNVCEDWRIAKVARLKTTKKKK